MAPNRKPPRGLPKQKAVRLDPDLVERVEERAMRESLALGLNIDFSALVRRGLAMVLAAPTPELPEWEPCNVASIGRGQASRCLTCGQGGQGREVVCPRLNKVVKR